MAGSRRHAGQADSAAAILGRALEAAPQEPQLMMALALAYRDMGERGKSVEMLESVYKLRPDDGRIAGNLGAVYVEMRRGEQAEAHLRLALKTDPERRLKWLANLSQALKLQGKQEEAVDTATEALRLAPTDRRLQELFRTIQQEGGEWTVH